MILDIKTFILLSLFTLGDFKSVPHGRRLRPEEHWRPAEGRDLSAYSPVPLMVEPGLEPGSWEHHLVTAARGVRKENKGNRIYHWSEGEAEEGVECGREGPPSKERSTPSCSGHTMSGRPPSHTGLRSPPTTATHT